MNEYILAFDQGTTSSRAIVFDHSGLPVASAQKEFTQIYPQPGWVEHDPEEIWSSQAGVAVNSGMGRIEKLRYSAIGIQISRNNSCWDRATGNFIMPSLADRNPRNSVSA